MPATRRRTRPASASQTEGHTEPQQESSETAAGLPPATAPSAASSTSLFDGEGPFPASSQTKPPANKSRPVRQRKARINLPAPQPGDDPEDIDDDEWTPERQATTQSTRSSSSEFEPDSEAIARARRRSKERQQARSQQRRRSSQVSKSLASSLDAASSQATASQAGKRKQSAAAAAAEDSDEDESAAKSSSSGKPSKKRKKKETAEERIERLHPEIKGVWDTLKQVKAGEDFPLRDPPQELAVTLLPFQVEGVSWLCHQEQSEFHGGILADEMGMGKTIQTIALFCARKAPERPRGRKPSLVICPPVALMQWRAEFEVRTKPDTFKILVYHGSSRSRDTSFLGGYDIVLTTYSVVESEWRRQQSGFTRKGQKVKEPSTLHAVDWHRIVLDEAHFIKDRWCSTARSIFNLTGDFKWSLTGTPLQNRVGELYSLVKFLKADPYSYYFCRQCECKSLHWQFSDNRHCDDCGHKRMSHFCWWNKEILRPIQKYGHVGAGLAAFERLQQLLRTMMLRRTKAERGHEMGLPPRVVHTRRDLFSHEEEDFYEALFSESKTKFEAFVQAGTVLNNYAHIFELLMRMRQSVNHPWLVTHKAEDGGSKHVCGICHEEAEDPIRSACKHVFCREDAKLYLTSSVSESTACPVCYRPLSIDLTQPAVEIEEPEPTAKSARKKKTSIVSRLDFERWRSSTKIEALLEELMADRAKGLNVKSIVFSQFTQFLDLLDWRLQRAGIRCVKLDGRMSPAHRANVIDAFNNTPQITVFLISLKAGGLALNLVAANRVYLCDPWWNPAVEVQAMDRIHRLGQHRPVEVRRLLIENSIEARIDELQEKKRLLFESTVGMDSSALNRLTEDDLRFLFVL